MGSVPRPRWYCQTVRRRRHHDDDGQRPDGTTTPTHTQHTAERASFERPISIDRGGTHGLWGKASQAAFKRIRNLSSIER